MDCPEDGLMEKNLVYLEELRRDVHDMRERIAQRFSETDEHLQHYVQFELLKAQGYLKNVSERLAAHRERHSHDACKDHQNFKDAAAKGGKVSSTCCPSAWAGNPHHQSKTEKPLPESKAAQLGSSKQVRQQQKQRQAQADLESSSSKKMASNRDEPHGKSRGRAVVDGSSQASKVKGGSLLTRYIDDSQASKQYLNGKKSQRNHPSPVIAEGKPAGRHGSAIDSRVGETDKRNGRQHNKTTQDWDRQQQNRLLPGSREVHTKRLSSECGHSETVDAPRYAAATISNCCLPIIGEILPHCSNVRTRFIQRRQDHDMRALFGL